MLASRTVRRVAGSRVLSRGARTNVPAAVRAQNRGVQEEKSPWKAVKDKKTRMVYYWNTDTDEVTDVGAARPKHWMEVRADDGESYFWCPETDETTAVGEPRPSHLDGGGGSSSNNIYAPAGGPVSFGASMKSMFLWGFGMSAAFGLVRVMIG